jgi:exocyst complex component 8
MYQLSHILVDQRSLIEQIREETLLDDQKNVIGEPDAGDTEQDQNKKAIAIIKDALIGYSKSFDEKFFIHEGSLIELDPNDYRPICRSHLFLFNDILIIAKIKHDKKLEFMAEYETKKLAVINIKELTGVKNAINIITSDGSRIYQTINLAAKSEWIEKFEVSIKFNQPMSGAKSRKGPAPQPPKTLQKQKSSVETQSIGSDATLSPTASIMTENFAPEWVNSAPEEIQAEIAQRHFEDSLILIQKTQDYIQKNPSFYNSEEINDKVKSLKTILSSVLLHELSTTQCRDLQSVLRSSRRLLKLLVEMGKSREASSILLKVCTTAIRTSQRQARRNNLLVSDLFFCDLAQVASEFLRAFQSQVACTSALVVWSNDELQYFSQQLIKHYLTRGTSLETVAKVVESVREPCSQLTKIGLDLSYYMEGLLRGTLEQLIEESRYRLIENITRTDTVWQPYNLGSKSNLKVLVKELNGMGVDLSELITGDTWINLTQSTVNFCRHFLSVTESCATIGKNSILKPDCEQLLKELFVAQYNIKPTGSENVDVSLEIFKFFSTID